MSNDAEARAPQCRNERQRLGLSYPRSSCAKCGLVIRAGWRCAQEAERQNSIPAADEIKAAYKQGWNDREADILERADSMGLPDPISATAALLREAELEAALLARQADGALMAAALHGWTPDHNTQTEAEVAATEAAIKAAVHRALAPEPKAAMTRSIPAAAAALLREAGWRVEEPRCEVCKGQLFIFERLDPHGVLRGSRIVDCPTCNGTGARP